MDVNDSFLLSWISIIDPWVLSPKLPVAVSQWYLDAVSHVPRVCAAGRGNTISRTPLIIFVFREFGAFVDLIPDGSCKKQLACKSRQ